MYAVYLGTYIAVIRYFDDTNWWKHFVTNKNNFFVSTYLGRWKMRLNCIRDRCHKIFALIYVKVDLTNWMKRGCGWPIWKTWYLLELTLFQIHKSFSFMLGWCWCQAAKCCFYSSHNKLSKMKGGSPGLVVTGGDSCSEGHGFESQHHILDGHFSHLFV